MKYHSQIGKKPVDIKKCTFYLILVERIFFTSEYDNQALLQVKDKYIYIYPDAYTKYTLPNQDIT